MTPNIAFTDARDLLVRAHDDPDRASASFRWPDLEAFNWTTHWFDELADGNRQPALRVITDEGQETVSFAELLDRPLATGTARRKRRRWWAMRRA